MIELKLSDKKEFNITVNKAHKMLSLLQKVENDKKADLNISTNNSSKYSDSNTTDTFTVNYATIVTYNEDDLKSLIHNQVQKKNSKLARSC